MIRKNIYLTEKQIEFIQRFIKEEGGGTETDVMRKALDQFIESKSSKFGNLMVFSSIRLEGLYVEVSPRATGKTYRLIKAATEYLDSDSKHKVNIVCPNKRSQLYIKQKIGEYYKNRIFTDNTLKSDWDTNLRTFYDEFDYMECLGEVDSFGYYCGTLKEQRNLKDILEKKCENDFFVKLMRANKGKIITYCGISEPSIDFGCLNLDEWSMKKTEFLNNIFN